MPSLLRLVESDHEVVAVVSRPDAPTGRGRAVVASPVASRAKALGIRLLQPSSTGDPAFADELDALAPDCCPIVAFGGLIPEQLLTVPRFGWVNLHFSLLPTWRGAAPVQHALLHGDEVTGATTFLLDAGLDTGPVFGTVTEPIGDRDTSSQLLDRLASTGADLLTRTMNAIGDGTATVVPQAEVGVSHAPKLTPEAGHVDWGHPALAIDRRIRACTAAPGAWTNHGGARLKLLPVTMAPEVIDLVPGELRTTKTQVLVGTGSHARSTRRRPGNGASPDARGRLGEGAARRSGLVRMTPPSRRHQSAGVSKSGGQDVARTAALQVMQAVSERDAYANLALPATLRTVAASAQDAAFATELTYGTLRWRGTYDAIIASCSDRPLDDLDTVVLNTLRLGAHQLFSMSVPTHAAVSTSVDLVRSAVGHGPTGFANAVMRKMAGRTLEGWLTQLCPDDSAASLSVRYSHPQWIVERVYSALGDWSQTVEMLQADNLAPPMSLVARPGRSTVEELVRLGALPGRWSPVAALWPGGDPANLAPVGSGDAGIQDEGSQLVTLAVANAAIEGADHRWLDLCAGPGGKAALLGGVASGREATLTAVELHEHRAALIRAIVTSDVEVVVSDGTSSRWATGAYDRVLVDVPCSGLGSLRRRPESRWRKQPSDLDALVQLQRRLLSNALAAVRPGGIVGYVTCSPLPEETREVVDSVLADDRGSSPLHVSLLDARPLLPGVPDLGGGPDIQLWPQRHGTDAMYLALLRRDR